MVLSPARRVGFERLGLYDPLRVAAPVPLPPPPREPPLPRQSVIHVQGAEAELNPGSAE
jgi:hypothetical protein